MIQSAPLTWPARVALMILLTAGLLAPVSAQAQVIKTAPPAAATASRSTAWQRAWSAPTARAWPRSRWR